jgi:hypothetical protein
MTLVLWMAAASLGSWLAAALFLPAHAAAIFFGMLGPLVAVAGTWLLVERASKGNPAGLASVLVGAFAVKMIFFGLYVVAVVKLAGVGPMPFVLSFTVYFLSLYVAEALLLRRLSSRLT